ncbi:MAG: hypothetical protein HY738_19705 [Bacteroidia bacterium]|nr:hypothetical protein [Bacteroidia bacterium]
MGNIREPLYPDVYYHIYNHGNAKDDIFIFQSDYYLFLKKYMRYINPIADTYCYCLMPNHFHFLLKIKPPDEILQIYKTKYPAKQIISSPNMVNNSSGIILATFISKQFADFFNSYSKSFNKIHNRRGSLFLDNFKRKPVIGNDYLIKMVHYIHYNPVSHGFVDEITEWKFSSYNIILSTVPTFLKRNDVVGWFENLENFVSYHKRKPEEL